MLNEIIISNLSEVITELESKQPLSLENSKLLDQSKRDLEQKLSDRAQRLIFRSKARWYCEGERNTKYFYSLEKAKYNAKSSYSIFDNNEKIVEGNEAILQCQQEFYQDLYSEGQIRQF